MLAVCEGSGPGSTRNSGMFAKSHARWGISIGKHCGRNRTQVVLAQREVQCRSDFGRTIRNRSRKASFQGSAWCFVDDRRPVGPMVLSRWEAMGSGGTAASANSCPPRSPGAGWRHRHRAAGGEGWKRYTVRQQVAVDSVRLRRADDCVADPRDCGDLGNLSDFGKAHGCDADQCGSAAGSQSAYTDCDLRSTGGRRPDADPCTGQ